MSNWKQLLPGTKILEAIKDKKYLYIGYPGHYHKVEIFIDREGDVGYCGLTYGEQEFWFPLMPRTVKRIIVKTFWGTELMELEVPEYMRDGCSLTLSVEKNLFNFKGEEYAI